METLALAVAAGALAALGAGFAAGYICGRRCKKDDDDNMPYPDTEYEYFEQRQNINRLVELATNGIVHFIHVSPSSNCFLHIYHWVMIH